MSFEKYYENQCGRGNQDFFKGTRYQRGHGIGNVLGSLIRSVLPYVRRTAVNAGKDIIQTGLSQSSKLIDDVVRGQPVKQAFKKRALEGGQQLVNKRLKPNKTVRNRKRAVKRHPAPTKKRPKDIFV